MQAGQISGPLGQHNVPGRKTPNAPGETILANDREIGSEILYAQPSPDFLFDSLVKDHKQDNKAIVAERE